MFESTTVKAKVFTDETGIPLEVPVIVTVDGPLEVLLDYLIARWGQRSPAWMLKVVFAVRLFLEYLSVHLDYTDEQAIFESFRQKLILGTIGADGDPSGLWWSPRGAHDANRITGNLTELFNWWGKKNPGKAVPAHPWTGGAHDLRVALAAYIYRRNQAFLGHTWDSVEEASKRASGAQVKGKANATPSTIRSTPPEFPETRILDLILKGFKVGSRFNLRDMLITLLMNGAGFRESEPFHLYLWDVMEDPAQKGLALVLIHHPAYGAAPRDPNWVELSGRQRTGTRAQYLAEHYGLTPRHRGLSTTAVGWKGGAHETDHGGFYKQAYWFPQEFGELFWTLWTAYMGQVADIDMRERTHPYAFMNTMREPLGHVYKLGKFQDSHANAVRRIGLIPSKNLGTSEHGHRHAYAQRLRRAGVSPRMIMRFLHHTDPASQEVYTEANNKECHDELSAAAKRISGETVNLREGITNARPTFASI